MSLFDDDFYSTKVNRKSYEERESRKFRGNRVFDDGFGRGVTGAWFERLRDLKSRPAALAAWSAAAGALAVLLFIVAIGHNGSQAKSAAAFGSGSGGENGSAGIAGDVRQTSGDSVVKATEKVRPTIVSIMSSRVDDKSQQSGVGIGSGVIFQKSGDKARILTNNHVVEGATSFEIMMSTGDKRKGTLLGKDYITDLAVLEMDGVEVKRTAEFGDSDALQAGESVIALGNPLGLGSSPTVTGGIVSSPKRTIPISLSSDGDYDWQMDVIQTDAAINQGNSGGALVNMEGKVVGINTMKIADIGVEGLGFAIPIKSAQPVIDSLIKYHKVKRPQLGVRLVDLSSFKGADVLKLPAEVKTGIIVLEASGPAKDAGLMSQDVIVELDGQRVGSVMELRKYLYDHKGIGEKLTVTYYRAGKKVTATAALAESADPDK